MPDRFVDSRDDLRNVRDPREDEVTREPSDKRGCLELLIWLPLIGYCIHRGLSSDPSIRGSGGIDPKNLEGLAKYIDAAQTNDKRGCLELLILLPMIYYVYQIVFN